MSKPYCHLQGCSNVDDLRIALTAAEQRAEQAEAELAAEREVLASWLEAWNYDAIGPVENGITAYGLDEGFVMSMRLMEDTLTQTRKILNLPQPSQNDGPR